MIPTALAGVPRCNGTYVQEPVFRLLIVLRDELNVFLDLAFRLDGVRRTVRRMWNHTYKFADNGWMFYSSPDRKSEPGFECFMEAVGERHSTVFAKSWNRRWSAPVDV